MALVSVISNAAVKNWPHSYKLPLFFMHFSDFCGSPPPSLYCRLLAADSFLYRIYIRFVCSHAFFCSSSAASETAKMKSCVVVYSVNFSTLPKRPNKPSAVWTNFDLYAPEDHYATEAYPFIQTTWLLISEHKTRRLSSYTI